MNYYSFHIGDYRRDTTHFSMLEHGAYRQLIDWLYLDEKPIPKETEVVFRRLSARTEEEKKAIKIVLSEMFELTEEGYVQHRCMEEISSYKGKADRARQAGKLGGRPKKTEVVISGLSKETEEKANHKPITNNQEPVLKPSNTTVLLVAGGDAPKCPHQEIIALYHKILPQCHQIRDWTAAREKALATRWKEKREHQSLRFWESLFKYIASCPFLVGKAGSKPFLASLDWICKAENFAKIREGRYEAAA